MRHSLILEDIGHEPFSRPQKMSFYWGYIDYDILVDLKRCSIGQTSASVPLIGLQGQKPQRICSYATLLQFWEIYAWFFPSMIPNIVNRISNPVIWTPFYSNLSRNFIFCFTNFWNSGVIHWKSLRSVISHMGYYRSLTILIDNLL